MTQPQPDPDFHLAEIPTADSEKNRPAFAAWVNPPKTEPDPKIYAWAYSYFLNTPDDLGSMPFFEITDELFVLFASGTKFHSRKELDALRDATTAPFTIYSLNDHDGEGWLAGTTEEGKPIWEVDPWGDGESDTGVNGENTPEDEEEA